MAKTNPGAGQATGAQEKLECTPTVARCERCHHRITAAQSLAAGLGRDCRRHRSRSTFVADRLVELAFGVDSLPFGRLKALDDLIELAFEVVR